MKNQLSETHVQSVPCLTMAQVQEPPPEDAFQPPLKVIQMVPVFTLSALANATPEKIQNLPRSGGLTPLGCDYKPFFFITGRKGVRVFQRHYAKAEHAKAAALDVLRIFGKPLRFFTAALPWLARRFPGDFNSAGAASDQPCPPEQMNFPL